MLSSLLLAEPGWAQSDASLEGHISDPTGAAIAGATVKIRNLQTAAERNLTTDETGRFEAVSLQIGAYSITVSKEGLQTETKMGVNVALGQRTKLELVLQIGDIHQSIEVPSDSGAVTVTTEDIAGLVAEREMKELPLNGRSYDQLLTLNPGILNYTSQRAGGTGTSNSAAGNMFSASGRRPQENLYLLNGVEFTSASEINNTPGGVSGQLLGIEAVREFAVLKDSYGAEFGKRPGAQVNIVTASGGNLLHGSIYEFARDSALDARNYFDRGAIPSFQRNVFGASLSGPLQKDRIFLFGNYEGFRQNSNVSDLTLVPDAAARARAVETIRPLLALWPMANGPELLTSTGAPSGIAEAFTTPSQHIRQDFATTRFDQSVSANDSFASAYTVDDSEAHSPAGNPITRDVIFMRQQVISLSEMHIFSTNALNRATFGFSRGGFYFNSGTTIDLPAWIQPGQPVGAVIVGGGTTLNGASQITNGGTNAGSNLTAARNLFTGSDQVTLTHANHSINFGLWLQRIQANDTLVQDQYGQASFTSLQTFLQGTVSTYSYAPSYTPLNWRSLAAAVYAEDATKVNASLEVRIGFRSEFTSGWNEAHGRASNYLFDSKGVIARQPTIGNSAFIRNNAKFLPAPRFGLAWAPFRSKQTVVHAGFGLYYGLLDNLSYRLDQTAPYNAVLTVKNIPFSSIAPDVIYPGAEVVPSGVQPDLKTPTVESWSLKIEQQISPNTSLRVGYIGSHGYHELLSADANVPAPTICPTSSCPLNYPAGTFYYPPNAPLANNAVPNTTHWLSQGISSYHGFEIGVVRHLIHGLHFRSFYTFSKALDDGDNMNTSVAMNSPAFVANPRQPKADYARASFDVRHAAVFSATYDLPFGRRKGSQSTWRSGLIGDWQASAIETLHTGLPFTPQLSYNPSNDGDTRNPVRPSINPNFVGPIVEGAPTQYFNPNAFIQPLPGTYGNASRNMLQGPALAEMDLAVAKRFLLSDHLNLQFRAEVFNLLNHANFNTPNPVVYTSPDGGPSPTAGVITATSTTSRQAQLGLKLLW